MGLYRCTVAIPRGPDGHRYGPGDVVSISDQAAEGPVLPLIQAGYLVALEPPRTPPPIPARHRRAAPDEGVTADGAVTPD